MFDTGGSYFDVSYAVLAFDTHLDQLHYEVGVRGG
jgi:hypothetical protein